MITVWADKARLDLAEIVDYFANRSPAFTDRLLIGVDDVRTRLVDHPDSGRKVAFHALRKAWVRPGKYLLFYRVTSSGNGVGIEVARIIHGERDWFTEL